MTMGQSLEQQAMDTVERYEMLIPGERVIVALSGGADSMALLAFLYDFQDRAGIRVEAAHVNHMLRGDQAEADEQFVRKVCGSLGIPLHVRRADVSAYAREHGIGIETAGREVRYDFFASFGPDCKVATAHTLSDSVETVLAHLSRGSSLRGLCGIPPVRGNVIRPLIDCTREQVEDYCRRHDIRYCSDQTNFSRDYTRNQIRLDLVPAFRQLNPAFEEAVRRFTAEARADEEYLGQLADHAVESAELPPGYDAHVLASLDAPVRRRALYRILYRQGGVMPEHKHLKKAEQLLNEGGRASLNGGINAVVAGGLLRFGDRQAEGGFFSFPLQPGSHPIPGGTVEITQAPVIHKKFKNEDLDICIDCAKINRQAVVRSRLPGDRIRLPGRPCKRLKKLLNEAHVPLDERDGRVVVSDSAGVLWVEGFGPDQRAQVQENTTLFYQIRIWRNI